MAIYDRRHNKIVVRVVYDGAARSGKTTNVRQICASFTTRKRGQLETPEESAGRTQYFDWLQLDTGLVGGYPMRCQIVTVPGQDSLRHRRLHLLSSADVVVFVVDSSPDGMLDASRAHGELLESVAEQAKQRGRDPVPVIVQANKQDLPDVLNPTRVHATLGLPPDTTVCGAESSSGIGVRETLVLAIRAAADRVQRGLLSEGVDAIDGLSEDVDELLGAMRAAEALLRPLRREPSREQVNALMRWRPEPLDFDSGRASGLSPHEAPPGVNREAAAETKSGNGVGSVAEASPSNAAEVDTTVTYSEASAANAAARVDTAHEAIAIEPAATAPAANSHHGASQAAEPAASSRESAAAREPIVAPIDPSPLFPDPLVPSGFIWPGTTGRVLLQELAGQRFTPRHDLVGRHGAVDGSGASDMLIYEAGPWFLKTSRRRRYEDVDTARTALLQMARKKVMLGDMLLPHTVLSLRPDEHGGVWLWTVAPLVSTLRSDMFTAEQAGDAAALARALTSFARAAVEAMLLARRHGILLDVHPGNFACADDTIAYIDDDIESGHSLALIGTLLLQRVHEYEHHPSAVEQYVAALERQICDRLTAQDIIGLDLAGEVRDAPARSSAVRAARSKLEQAVNWALHNRT